MRLPSPAFVVALLALLVALGGTAWAAAKITGSQIADGTVTGRDVRNRSIGPADLSAAARRTTRGAAGPAGTTGPAGQQGPQGPPGATGPAGPSDVVIVAGDGFDVPDSAAKVPVIQAALPAAGAYRFTAQLNLFNASSTVNLAYACELVVDGQVLPAGRFARLEGGLDGTLGPAAGRLTRLVGGFEAAGPGALVVRCSRTGNGGDLYLENQTALEVQRAGSVVVRRAAGTP